MHSKRIIFQKVYKGFVLTGVGHFPEGFLYAVAISSPSFGTLQNAPYNFRAVGDEVAQPASFNAQLGCCILHNCINCLLPFTPYILSMTCLLPITYYTSSLLHIAWVGPVCGVSLC